MEITKLRTRILVGAFATVVVVGSGVATALVTSNDTPTLGAAVDTTSSTGDTVDVTTPSTPGATTGTTPTGSDDPESDDSNDTTDATEVYWGPECEGEPTTNHGQYVSSQPKGGDSRSEAAQSDCGKPLASVGDDPAAPEDEAAAAPETVNPANGSGNSSNGNGNAGTGNGNGYGRNK